MRRLWYVYGGLLLALTIRITKKFVWHTGEWLKRLGRKLVSWGTVTNAGWSRELLLKCYASCPDAEVFFGGKVYRGPIYAIYRDFSIGDAFVLKFNWVAERDQLSTIWSFSGSYFFRVECYEKPDPRTSTKRLDRYGKPTLLPNGDVWFGFKGGYAVLYLGEPLSRLSFKGNLETPRELSYL